MMMMMIIIIITITRKVAISNALPLETAVPPVFLDFSHGQGTTWRRNIAENFNGLSRVHQRYRRQTTDRQTDGR